MSAPVVILYGELSENPKPDELDVLNEVSIVKETLSTLGYQIIEMEFGLNLLKTQQDLMRIKPLLVFNLVETIDNRGELHYIAPALLEYLKIPYTGVTSDHLVITTNKILTKEILRLNEIKTPDWFYLDQYKSLDKNKKYILKPLKEDGSLEIDENSVFSPLDSASIEKIKQINSNNYFIEEFLDGREFNISVIGGKQEPEILPIAEMKFHNFPEGKPKVMGFTAKWDENSFEYKNTNRTFDIDFVKTGFSEEIHNLCLKCWNAFKFKGYIRIDIRLKNNNELCVLEINGNPCISEGSGFLSAIRQAGFTYKEALERIIQDAFKLK